MIPILSDEIRPWFGLMPVAPTWARTELEGALVYFDDDRIVKIISPESGGSRGYFEYDYDLPTQARRTLPAGRAGAKPKPLTVDAILKRVPSGFRFEWDQSKDVLWVHAASGRTIYVGGGEQTFVSRDSIGAWIAAYVQHAPPGWRDDLARERARKKQHVAFRSGDVFLVPFRGAYGFPDGTFGVGRVLLDLKTLAKKKAWGDRAWDLCCEFWGSAIVQFYRTKLHGRELEVSSLRGTPAFPAENGMYLDLESGEFPIVGKLPVEPQEIDLPEFLWKGTLIKGGIYADVGRILAELGSEVRDDFGEPRFRPSFGGTGAAGVRRMLDEDRVELSDLRGAPAVRGRILASLGLDPAMSYDEMCRATGSGPTAVELLALAR